MDGEITHDQHSSMDWVRGLHGECGYTCIDNMVVYATLHEHSTQDCQNLHRKNSNEEKNKKVMLWYINTISLLFSGTIYIQLSLRVFIVYEYTCMYVKLAKDEQNKSF